MDYRDTGNIGHKTQEEVKQNKKPNGQSRMDKTETLATLVTRHRKKSSKTKNLMVNQEWIRQRHWQHWSQDTGRSQAKQKT